MKRFVDLKISTKMVVGFLMIAMISAIIGAVGLFSSFSLRTDNKKMYEENTLALQYAGSASTTFVLIRYNTYKLSVLEDAEKIKDVADNSKMLLSALDDYMSQSGNVLVTAEFLTAFNKINDEWQNEYRPDMEKVMTLALAGDAEGARALIPGLATLGTTMYNEFVSFLAMLADDAEFMANENDASALTLSIIIAAATVSGVIIAVILALLIAGIISKPLNKAVEIADKLAAGDLGMQLQLDGSRKDEIGKLAVSFDKLLTSTKKQVQTAKQISEGDLTVQVELRSDNDMLGKGLADLVGGLRDLVASIYAAAEQVSDGSGMLSNSSSALSQGATEQAGAVQELSATIQEIASQTAINARNAHDANELANSVKTNADQGNAQMKSMLSAMDEINESSRNIVRITKVIDDIAFQTNILALNAAVEAARAGQHGKGFAVVAEEVRTLAAKSANAVKETTELIENSVKKAEAGTKIAIETAESLTRIAEQIERAAELNHAIAEASNEQSISIDQVNMGITQVSQVVQTNAATAEESAAASEELSGQAERLKEIVGIFRMDISRETAKKPRIDMGRMETRKLAK